MVVTFWLYRKIFIYLGNPCWHVQIRFATYLQILQGWGDGVREKGGTEWEQEGERDQEKDRQRERHQIENNAR